MSKFDCFVNISDLSSDWTRVEYGFLKASNTQNTLKTCPHLSNILLKNFFFLIRLGPGWLSPSYASSSSTTSFSSSHTTSSSHTSSSSSSFSSSYTTSSSHTTSTSSSHTTTSSSFSYTSSSQATTSSSFSYTSSSHTTSSSSTSSTFSSTSSTTSSSTAEDVKFGHDVAQEATEHTADGRRQQVEDDGVQAGVEGAGEQSHLPPALVLPAGEAHHMGEVVGAKAAGEHQQGAQGQTYSAEPPPPADVRQAEEDADEVDVAEAADEEGRTEEHQEELQAQGQQHTQLLLAEVHVAPVGDLEGGVDSAVQLGHQRHNVDANEVEGTHHPEEDTGDDGVARPAVPRVHDGERHAQVALHTDGRQQQSAVVYGGVEQEVGERAQEVRQLPGHVVQGLLHLEGQEGEEEEVRDGEAEEEHVDGRGLAVDLAAEGVEG